MPAHRVAYTIRITLTYILVNSDANSKVKFKDANSKELRIVMVMCNIEIINFNFQSILN